MEKDDSEEVTQFWDSSVVEPDNRTTLKTVALCHFCAKRQMCMLNGGRVKFVCEKPDANLPEIQELISIPFRDFEFVQWKPDPCPEMTELQLHDLGRVFVRTTDVEFGPVLKIWCRFRRGLHELYPTQLPAPTTFGDIALRDAARRGSTLRLHQVKYDEVDINVVEVPSQADKPFYFKVCRSELEIWH